MKEELIKRFVNNEQQFEIVFDEIQKFFSRKREATDVNVLASRTLSIWDLEDAKKHLQTYRASGEEESSTKIKHV